MLRFYDIGYSKRMSALSGWSKRTFIVNKTAEGRVNDGATKSVCTTRKILHIYVNLHELEELIIS